MTASRIEKLYVERSAADLPETRQVTARLGLPAVEVDGPAEVHAELKRAADPVAAGKRVLLLARNRGAFVKDCPGTAAYTCCGYRILHVGTYCTMDCAYCILQAYFHPPLLQYFVNHEDLFAELERHCAPPGPVLRIGTGEFTDSLIWEAASDLTRRLVPFFAGQRRAVLELKTKTTAVGRLRGLAHGRKTIVAWSLNTPAVIAELERGTAPLAARLKAAAACRRWGYPLAFHFDPIVIYEGCEEDYRRLVRRLLAALAPLDAARDIAWISLGSLRFMPALKPIVQRRFPRSSMVYAELVPGLDGKLRYFKPLRISVYRAVADAFREAVPQAPMYFCMEDEEVWRKVLGFDPAERGGLARMLDERAAACCGAGEGR